MCATRCLMPDSPSLTTRSDLTASATSCRCTIPRTSSGWMQRGTPTVSEKCVSVCARVLPVYGFVFVCVCAWCVWGWGGGGVS